MNEKNIKKMEELLSNEEFSQKIVEAGTYEKMYALLSAEGMDASFDEFSAYLADCRKIMVEKGLISEDGELSPELLEQVNGGVKWGMTIMGAVYVGLGAAATAIGCGAGLIMAAEGVVMIRLGTKKDKKK